jgi:predicted metal-dependent phosphoesterase TrpH
VVELAAVQGLEAVAITDHDVVSGVSEAQAAGARLGVEVIAGVELTARWRGRTCHVLGYYLDPAAPTLIAALAAARAAAEATVANAIAALRARGFDLTPADLAGYHARYPSPTTLLLAMVRRRLLRTRADLQALLEVLRTAAPPWTAEEAVALVHAAGGAAVLAHPGRRPSAHRAPRVPFDGAALQTLAAAGLDGVEVEHPSHTAAQRAEYAALACDLDLVATGGSDWHGRRAERLPGYQGVERAQLAALRARAKPPVPGHSKA